MKYKIIEKQGNEAFVTIGKYTKLEEAQKEFNSRVTAFLDGETEEPVAMTNSSYDFYFEYADGDKYSLQLWKE